MQKGMSKSLQGSRLTVQLLQGEARGGTLEEKRDECSQIETSKPPVRSAINFCTSGSLLISWDSASCGQAIRRARIIG